MVVMMNVRPGPDNMHPGSDKELHDAFTPAHITARAGQTVTTTVYGHNTDAHSFTMPDWNHNVVIPGVKHEGVLTVTTLRCTANKAARITGSAYCPVTAPTAAPWPTTTPWPGR